MSKYGDLNFDEQWYNEPIEKYLNHKRTVDEVTDSRFNAIERTSLNPLRTLSGKRGMSSPTGVTR